MLGDAVEACARSDAVDRSPCYRDTASWADRHYAEKNVGTDARRGAQALPNARGKKSARKNCAHKKEEHKARGDATPPVNAVTGLSRRRGQPLSARERRDVRLGSQPRPGHDVL